MPMSTTDSSEEESIERIDRTWRRSLQMTNHEILAIHACYCVANTEPFELLSINSSSLVKKFMKNYHMMYRIIQRARLRCVHRDLYFLLHAARYSRLCNVVDLNKQDDETPVC